MGGVPIVADGTSKYTGNQPYFRLTANCGTVYACLLESARVGVVVKRGEKYEEKRTSAQVANGE